MISFEQLVGALGARPSGSGWYNCRCPAHSDGAPSFGFRIGNPIIFNCFNGCERSEIIAALKQQSLWPVTIEGVVPTENTAGNDPLDRLRRINDEVVPLAGTYGDAYLRGRSITVRSGDLAYHRKLFHPWSGRSWPALVACVRDVAGQAVALHTTYLRQVLPVGSVSKAPDEPVRAATGRIKGHAVHLAQAGAVLILGEGIETVLSAMQLSGLPGWAALISRNLPNVELPDVVREVILLADNDVAGERAALRAAQRFAREGRQVRIAHSPVGNDFNDALMLEGLTDGAA